MSTKKFEKHDIVSALKIITSQLGRIPTLLEFTRQAEIGEGVIRRRFGSWAACVHAADLSHYSVDKNSIDPEAKAATEKLIRKYKALCSKKEQIQGFFVHTLDLKEMFERAGNPPSLKMVGLGDVHVKYLDPAAVHCMLQFVAWYMPHLFLIIGDFADCEGISHWDAGTLEPKRLVPEMLKARKVLEAIAKATPHVTTRIFCEGNHENWIQQALINMPELFDGLSELIDVKLDVQTFLALEKFGYDFFPMNHLVKIGKLHFTHGIYTASNHTKKHLDVFKGNIEYGHLHDKQEHNQTSLDGSMSAGCMGCLCRLDAQFLKGKPNNWVHLINCYEFFPDGSFTKFKPEIINGKVSVCGQVFVGDQAWQP